MTTKLEKEMAAEFGIPCRGLDLGKIKTFIEGARCPFNPNCRKVNTQKCDLRKCLSGVVHVATTKDQNSF